MTVRERTCEYEQMPKRQHGQELIECGLMGPLPYSYSVRRNLDRVIHSSRPMPAVEKMFAQLPSATAGGKVGERAGIPRIRTPLPDNSMVLAVASRRLPSELRPRDALCFQNESSDVVWSPDSTIRPSRNKVLPAVHP